MFGAVVQMRGVPPGGPGGAPRVIWGFRGPPDGGPPRSGSRPGGTQLAAGGKFLGYFVILSEILYVFEAVSTSHKQF